MATNDSYEKQGEMMQLNANRLGEMLLEAGLIDQFQLESALSMQRNLGGRIGSALVKLGYLPEETIIEFLETQEAYSQVSLDKLDIPPKLMALMPFERMLNLLVVPIELRQIGGEKNLRMAMTDPTNKKLIDDLQFATGCKVLPVLASEKDISTALNNNKLPEKPQSPAPVAEVLPVTENRSVSSNDISPDDPRLDRLLDILKKKGVLSVLDIERIKFS